MFFVYILPKRDLCPIYGQSHRRMFLYTFRHTVPNDNDNNNNNDELLYLLYLLPYLLPIIIELCRESEFLVKLMIKYSVGHLYL